MDFRDVEYFAALAEHRHVGRAAEALGLSQPALSLSLRRLERSVKSKLMNRTPKGVELTTAGTALLARFDRLRLARDDIVSEMTDLSLGHSGLLRIGTGAHIALHIASIACTAVLKDAPRLTLKVNVLDYEALIAGLCRGELDLGISTLQSSSHEDLVQMHLYDEPFVVYASANHRLASKKRVTLADIAQERMVVFGPDSSSMRRLKSTFIDAGLPFPRIALETGSMPLRNQIVASTDLLGYTAQRVVRLAAPHFRFAELRVKELEYVRRVGVIYRKNAYLSTAARRFIEILRATGQEAAA
jgi:DNA-binding transcriptional LysR family regulator